jgi:hypothetical protein
MLAMVAHGHELEQVKRITGGLYSVPKDDEKVSGRWSSEMGHRDDH